MATDRHTAHLLTPEGVADVLFEHTGAAWVSREPVAFTPGVDLLDFGGGITLSAGESLTYTLRIDLGP